MAPLHPPDRLAWALVHSRRRVDVVRGVELVQAALSVDAGASQRDLRYLLAVGQYRERHYLDARETLKGLLDVSSRRGGRARGRVLGRGGGVVCAVGGDVDWDRGCSPLPRHGTWLEVRTPCLWGRSACLGTGGHAVQAPPRAASTRDGQSACEHDGHLACHLLFYLPDLETAGGGHPSEPPPFHPRTHPLPPSLSTHAHITHPPLPPPPPLAHP